VRVALQLLFRYEFNPACRARISALGVHETSGERQPGKRLRCPFTTVPGPTLPTSMHAWEAADNWRIQRMAVVDRNVLRTGNLIEYCIRPDTPTRVVLDDRSSWRAASAPRTRRVRQWRPWTASIEISLASRTPDQEL